MAQLSDERGWNLTGATIRRYAQQAASCWRPGERVSDEQLRLTIGNYHADHALVEALRDPAHPGSSAAWTEWTGAVARILAKRLGAAGISGDATAQIADLGQEALIDLWRGLASFRYQSRFHTWAVTIVANCLARRLRAAQAQKRDVSRTRSLEAAEGMAESLADGRFPPLESVAQHRELTELVRDVLGPLPDKRLAVALDLWLNNDMSMRAIGETMRLSPARVHTLIHQALDLIGDRLEADEWGARS